MSTLGEFCNKYGERFVLSHGEGEVWIDGDEFGWQAHKVARLGFTFTGEEKAQIDRIVPLVWDFCPYGVLFALCHGLADYEDLRSERGEGHVRSKFYAVASMISAGLFPEATHEHGFWEIWDTVEHEEYLRRHGDDMSLAQYALMRGFATPEEGGRFLHTFAERAGCDAVTHMAHPENCWSGHYAQTMSTWLRDCAERERAHHDQMARLLGILA